MKRMLTTIALLLTASCTANRSALAPYKPAYPSYEERYGVTPAQAIQHARFDVERDWRWWPEGKWLVVVKAEDDFWSDEDTVLTTHWHWLPGGSVYIVKADGEEEIVKRVKPVSGGE